MDEPKTILVEDCLGNMGFRVKYEYTGHWTDVTVWEIVASENRPAGVVPCFQRKDSNFHPDGVYTTDEAERYLEGFIKWDGCSEFTFSPDEEDGHHFHWCGPTSYKKHFAILEHIYRRSQQLMAKGNNDPWPESQPPGGAQHG